MGKFNRIATSIDGLYIIEPTVFGDQRGFFMETYSRRDFADIGIEEEFVQDNHSKSSKAVLRGLHFQREHTQGKLVRVAAGAVLDVAVDLRPGSPTYGKWEKVLLTAENKLMFYVPPRFAHGFLTLEDGTEFLYKCTDFYHPESDGGIPWNDLALGIDWELGKWGIRKDELNISAKDSAHPSFESIDPYTLWR